MLITRGILSSQKYVTLWWPTLRVTTHYFPTHFELSSTHFKLCTTHSKFFETHFEFTTNSEIFATHFKIFATHFEIFARHFEIFTTQSKRRLRDCGLKRRNSGELNQNEVRCDVVLR